MLYTQISTLLKVFMMFFNLVYLFQRYVISQRIDLYLIGMKRSLLFPRRDQPGRCTTDELHIKVRNKKTSGISSKVMNVLWNVELVWQNIQCCVNSPRYGKTHDST